MANQKDNTEEHPKSIVEVLENTRSAVEGYAAAQNISELQSVMILIFNELRCIHWHFDRALAEEKVHASKGQN